MTMIIATAQPGTDTTPPSVLLKVTGAPNPPSNAYASNFSTSVDGWVAGSGTTLTRFTTVSPQRLVITGPGSVVVGEATRALSGLTAGATYRLKVAVYKTRGQIRLLAKDSSANVIAASAFVETTDSVRSWLQLDFKATTATATIALDVYQSSVVTRFGVVSTASYDIESVTVQPISTWLGTTITRWDANGTEVVVREDQGGNDVSGGTMTITDYEAALYGPVNYFVTDGLGYRTGSGVNAMTAPGTWLTIPTTAVPSAATAPTAAKAEMVTAYGATRSFNGSFHQIIGRSSPIANPGPLMMRSGQLDVFCLDYASATKVANLLTAGSVLMLRQPDFPGMDMYFIGHSVSLRPDGDPSPTVQRWIASIDYEEVPAP